MAILDDVKDALDLEIKALQQMEARLDDNVVRAVSLLLSTKGRVIFTGMGKAGHVARKLAATFSSTGTPSIFLHPGEAYHGDLGVVTRNDTAVVISNSGETEEVVKLLPCFKRYNVPVISLTGNIRSTLAANSDVALDTGVEREACPLNCAPTSSTTTAIAMGDAIACALVKARGFREEDFAVFHPGGSLGARLLLRVRDVMIPLDQTPTVPPATPLKEAIVAMSQGSIGSVFIVNGKRTVDGIFTDGDLRRLLQDGDCDLSQPIENVANLSPQSINDDVMAASALSRMEEKKISVLPVVGNDGEIVGSLQLHMLLRGGMA